MTSVFSERSEAKTRPSPASAEVVPSEWPWAPSCDELNPLIPTIARVFGSTRFSRPVPPEGTSNLPSEAEKRRSSKPIPPSPPGIGSGVIDSEAARSNAPSRIDAVMPVSVLWDTEPEGPGQAQADLGGIRSARPREAKRGVEGQAFLQSQDRAREPGYGGTYVALALDEEFGHRPERPRVVAFDDEAAEVSGRMSAGPGGRSVQVERHGVPPLGGDDRQLGADTVLPVDGREEHSEFRRHARPALVLQDAFPQHRLERERVVVDAKARLRRRAA